MPTRALSFVISCKPGWMAATFGGGSGAAMAGVVEGELRSTNSITRVGATNINDSGPLIWHILIFVHTRLQRCFNAAAFCVPNVQTAIRC